MATGALLDFMRKAGSVEFDSVKGTYQIAGGGENMWFTNDAFHFVWKKMSGDLTLAANLRWIGTNGNPHRKACLIIRQNLDPDAPYADAVLHGNGLSSLQYRETPCGETRESQCAAGKFRCLPGYLADRERLMSLHGPRTASASRS